MRKRIAACSSIILPHFPPPQTAHHSLFPSFHLPSSDSSNVLLIFFLLFFSSSRPLAPCSRYWPQVHLSLLSSFSFLTIFTRSNERQQATVFFYCFLLLFKLQWKKLKCFRCCIDPFIVHSRQQKTFLRSLSLSLSLTFCIR